MRMLYCPFRSLPSFSSRLPGGARSSSSGVEDQQLPVRRSLQFGREAPHRKPPEHALRVPVAEAADHRSMLSRAPINVKRYHDAGMRPSTRVIWKRYRNHPVFSSPAAAAKVFE
jgi:hypothetical protein